MLTRKNASFVRVYLDNDTYVDTTPDHRFMLRDGSYKEAQYLTNEDLMSQSLQIKVIKVEKLDVIEDAYDIEVESSNHNFVLTNGIFVHNCHTEDGAGFNGGASLSIISSRYGKSIKRIQNALAQMITDILNLKLINKGFNSYVNNFTVRMKAPVTQEEIDARAAQADNVRNVQDIINTLSDVSSTSTKLEITKALLTPYINNEVITILQQEIDKVKKEEEEGVNSNDNEENEITPSRGGSREREEPNELPREEPNELPTPEEIGAGIEEPSEENETPSEEETSRPIPTLDSMNNEEEGNYGESLEDGYLPTPEELGIDATKPLEQ